MRIGIKLIVPIVLLAFDACTANARKIVFRPAAENSSKQDERAPVPWRIVDSQSGAEAAGWLLHFLEGGVQKVEGTSPFQNSYVFIAEIHGTNFVAMSRWAEQFTPVQDLPRLVALRIEQRLLASATLYPDDEYGDFFASMIKAASDAVYTGAQKRETFWIKERMHSEDEPDGESEMQTERSVERYRFYVLLTINKLLLQTEIKSLMAEIEPAVPPARSQAAAIHHIQQNFFEGF